MTSSGAFVGLAKVQLAVEHQCKHDAVLLSFFALTLLRIEHCSAASNPGGIQPSGRLPNHGVDSRSQRPRHRSIFTKAYGMAAYADDGAWLEAHAAQFAAIQLPRELWNEAARKVRAQIFDGGASLTYAVEADGGWSVVAARDLEGMDVWLVDHVWLVKDAFAAFTQLDAHEELRDRLDAAAHGTPWLRPRAPRRCPRACCSPGQACPRHPSRPPQPPQGPRL